MDAFAVVYAGWFASQPFFAQRLYTTLGFKTRDEFMQRFAKPGFFRHHSHDLVCMARTWD
eukprot:gene16140-5681_t